MFSNRIKYVVGFYGYEVSGSIGTTIYTKVQYVDTEMAGFDSITEAEKYAKVLAEENPGKEVFIFKQLKSFTKEPAFKEKQYGD